MTKKFLIEGWRFLPHSYAVANMWQCLELVKRNLEVYHNDVPFFNKNWQTRKNLISPYADNIMSTIQHLNDISLADIVYRISYPYNFTPVNNKKLFIFATSEALQITPKMIEGNKELRSAHAESKAVIITTSQWSLKGFLRYGADPERIKVIPLGVDTSFFKPLSLQDKNVFRKKFNWKNNFVFLNISSLTPNKGIIFLLRAFSEVRKSYPQAILCLKGSNNLYNSFERLHHLASLLTPEEIGLIAPNLVFYGDDFSVSEIAALYQAADAYVSPYQSEAFNLPVLEAAACGLPVICTSNGSTDDFTNETFAKKIQSKLYDFGNEGIGLSPDLNHLIFLMKEMIENKTFIENAKESGSAFVQNSYTWKHVIDKLLMLTD